MYVCVCVCRLLSLLAMCCCVSAPLWHLRGHFFLATCVSCILSDVNFFCVVNFCRHCCGIYLQLLSVATQWQLFHFTQHIMNTLVDIIKSLRLSFFLVSSQQSTLAMALTGMRNYPVGNFLHYCKVIP